ncbi:MAG: hypothetical protein KDA89_23710 [Planctomycetaceae bacterium]|nr:hypothetical protein [Planctomycetaceae bacterium]
MSAHGRPAAGLTRRHLLGGIASLTLGSAAAVAQEDGEQPLPPGALDEEALGEALKVIGLKPIKTEQRYDFAFKTSIRGEEWKFSMSCVLSRNSETLWVMAWLDQIPETSAEVPRLALLRLLAANDRLGNGKFFAYIPASKRFVLQRVMRNENLNARELMESLQDLAISVADEYPIWAVANWAPQSDGDQPEILAGRKAAGDDVPLPRNPTAANQSGNTQTSEAATKFNERRVQ